MALLLIAGGAVGEVPDRHPMTAQILAAQEPITPIPAPPLLNPLKVALGERLFNDPRLSGDGSRACSSCHDTQSNGADANRYDKAPDGSQLDLNTNTVFNAALSFRFNWEGDIRTLHDHVAASLENPRIMDGRLTGIVSRLSMDGVVRQLFTEAYGHGPDEDSLLDAIATYERTLLTPDSRFDQWLRGDASALSSQERIGYQLFKSLGCISCHQGVNIGGNLFERHGIFHPLAAAKPEILRVPSLRNVATTPPYFHDGSAPTLEDAVRRMANAQLNRSLAGEQIDDIVAFLRTLTGTYRGSLVTPASATTPPVMPTSTTGPVLP